MDISANIKSIREAKRIKQVEIATFLKVEPSNYAKLEKRGNKLTIEQLEKIAGALGVGLLELLTGEPPTAVADGGRLKELEARIKELEEIREIQRELMTFLKDQIRETAELGKKIDTMIHEVEKEDVEFIAPTKQEYLNLMRAISSIGKMDNGAMFRKIRALDKDPQNEP